jgi:formylglycine-generating enzyme required for sulfatase activity
MARIDGLLTCIDRWEASPREDGAGRIGAAVSRPGAVPADHVSWEDADRSCRAAGKRLCSSDEWLVACRGPQGRRYPYGDDLDVDACNVSQLGKKAGKPGKRPSGSLPGCDNGRGVMDLSGNVWEWTATADRTGTLRQLWGGGFANDNVDQELTCGFRKALYQPANQRHSGIGYRCCRDAR